MALGRTALIVALIILACIVAGPLLLVGAMATALKVFLWAVLILCVIGIVAGFMGGSRMAGRGPHY